MKRAKIIALLKPGKPHDDPKSYRPISLLNILYKLLERLLHSRIAPRLYEKIPVEQAGFRPQRSSTDQILALTTHIEAGFQRNQKTSVVFIDLSAAYDTVWRQGLLYKLMREIPCKMTCSLIDSMLADRTFQVIMGASKSRVRKLNNGLPQGSVLAPLLFSLYIADMPNTTSKKFGYADDWAIAAQHRNIEETESILTSDIATLGEYFRRWRLQVNASKTETCCFHLHNKQAGKELNIMFENKQLKHNKFPKYLGVTLDRTLSFKEHLTKTAGKIKTRNNILHKLCGTTWGSSADTLRSSALGLVYSAAEYAAPVWTHSCHTNKIETQLNDTMRIISGTIRSTPRHWLPVLSHIPPPELRRMNALKKEYEKITNNPQHPANADLQDLERRRLRSRNPPMLTGKHLFETNFNLLESWQRDWLEKTTPESQNMPCIKQRPPGFDLPRKVWTQLNRARTNHGRCADFLYKWGKLSNPSCDCGEERQTVQHIVRECNLRAYAGDPMDLLMATDTAIEYLKELNVCL